MSRLMLAALTGALSLAAAPAGAVSILVTNASFEDNGLADGGYEIGSPAGWTAVSNAGYANLPAGLGGAPHGQNTGWIGSGVTGAAYTGALQQTVGETVLANMRYSLSVDVLRRPDVLLSPFRAELLSGETVLAFGGFTNDDVGAGLTRTLTVDFVSLAALDGPLTIRFRTLTPTADYRQVNIDNVRLDRFAVEPQGAVPEPAAWALMISGFGLAGATLRRRTRKAPSEAAPAR